MTTTTTMNFQQQYLSKEYIINDMFIIFPLAHRVYRLVSTVMVDAACSSHITYEPVVNCKHSAWQQIGLW